MGDTVTHDALGRAMGFIIPAAGVEVLVTGGLVSEEGAGNSTTSSNLPDTACVGVAEGLGADGNAFTLNTIVVDVDATIIGTTGSL